MPKMRSFNPLIIVVFVVSQAFAENAYAPAPKAPIVSSPSVGSKNGGKTGGKKGGKAVTTESPVTYTTVSDVPSLTPSIGPSLSATKKAGGKNGGKVGKKGNLPAPSPYTGKTSSPSAGAPSYTVIGASDIPSIIPSLGPSVVKGGSKKGGKASGGKSPVVKANPSSLSYSYSGTKKGKPSKTKGVKSPSVPTYTGSLSYSYTKVSNLPRVSQVCYSRSDATKIATKTVKKAGTTKGKTGKLTVLSSSYSYAYKNPTTKKNVKTPVTKGGKSSASFSYSYRIGNVASPLEDSPVSSYSHSYALFTTTSGTASVSYSYVKGGKTAKKVASATSYSYSYKGKTKKTDKTPDKKDGKSAPAEKTGSFGYV